MHLINGALIMLSKHVQLQNIATIKAGHPFRGKIPEVDAGDTRVVQVRDVDDNGSILWDKLIRTNITGRKMPEYLQEGDIIFAARGHKNFAAYVDKSTANAVCAPHYFLIRVNQDSLATNIASSPKVISAFIAWQLNQKPAKKYFKNISQGTAVNSIHRTLLAETPLTIPSIEIQQTTVALANAHIKEQQTLQALIASRNAQMEGIAKRLLL